MLVALNRGSSLTLTFCFAALFFAIFLCFTPTLCCDFVSFLNSATPAFSIAVKMGGPGATVVVAEPINVFIAASQ